MFIIKIPLLLCKTYEANETIIGVQETRNSFYVVHRRYAKNDPNFLSKSLPTEYKSDTFFRAANLSVFKQKVLTPENGITFTFLYVLFMF